ncbi:hypothetical protein Q7P35_004556 [Cladosporium inversicolor]
MLAQIISNTMAVITMNIGLQGDTHPGNLRPSPVIMTTNEDGQTVATVVGWATGQHATGVHAMLQGTPAGLDSEALLSLYEESKKLTIRTKIQLLHKGRLYI